MISYKIICVIIILTLIFIIKFCFNYNMIENFGATQWKRNPDCKYKISKTVKKILDENKLHGTDKNNWDLYLPCTYNDTKKELERISPTVKDQKVFIIDGANQITSKKLLWINLKKNYDLKTLTKFVPNTYILDDKNDLSRFQQDYKQNNIYILKKDIQRQQGLKITKDLNEILNSKKNNFVVVQELLQDPFLIDGRKINMRFYILVTCVDNKVTCYVHKDGFMYYTKLPFKANSDSWDHNITTGYIDRKVYEKNPLTHDDFRNYLNDLTNIKNKSNTSQVLSEIVFNDIYNLLKKVMMSLQTSICTKNNKTIFTSFQLFGADIGLNNKLDPVLIEINKGPDMGAKDKKDGDLKHGVLLDSFKILNIVEKGDINKFIKLF
jgi:tubulin polyglutamylase TTLL7